jgi:hypothetical protein
LDALFFSFSEVSASELVSVERDEIKLVGCGYNTFDLYSGSAWFKS